MKNFIFKAALLFLSSLAIQVDCHGQTQQTEQLSNSQIPYKSFERSVNYRSDDLLFRVIQFVAPDSGDSFDTSLIKNGRALYLCVTPFATHCSRHAQLSAAQIKQIRQKLIDFTANYLPDVLEPQEGQLYTALVFESNGQYSRFNFIGEIPPDLQSVLDSLDTEFKKAEKKEHDEYVATEKLLEEKYGDWQSRPGIIRSAGDGWLQITDTKKILQYKMGYLQPVTSEHPQQIPLYYALISYPSARVIGGAGRNRSSDPASSDGVTWSLTKDNEEEKGENLKKLEIEYHAINRTIRVENEMFQLSEGNLFIINFDDDWQVSVQQLKVRLTKSLSKQEALKYFKVQLGVFRPNPPNYAITVFYKL